MNNCSAGRHMTKYMFQLKTKTITQCINYVEHDILVLINTQKLYINMELRVVRRTYFLTVGRWHPRIFITRNNIGNGCPGILFWPSYTLDFKLLSLSFYILNTSIRLFYIFRNDRAMRQYRREMGY